MCSTAEAESYYRDNSHYAAILGVFCINQLESSTTAASELYDLLPGHIVHAVIQFSRALPECPEFCRNKAHIFNYPSLNSYFLALELAIYSIYNRDIKKKKKPESFYFASHYAYSMFHLASCYYYLVLQ